LTQRCEPHLESGFRAQVGVSELGLVQATLMTTTPHSVRRTPKLIRQTDPESFLLTCAVRGTGMMGEQDGHTVAGWIREHRLEQCRRDLADPQQVTCPIHVIAARWGSPAPRTSARPSAAPTASHLASSADRARQCTQRKDPCTY